MSSPAELPYFRLRLHAPIDPRKVSFYRAERLARESAESLGLLGYFGRRQFRSKWFTGPAVVFAATDIFSPNVNAGNWVNGNYPFYLHAISLLVELNSATAADIGITVRAIRTGVPRGGGEQIVGAAYGYGTVPFGTLLTTKDTGATDPDATAGGIFALPIPYVLPPRSRFEVDLELLDAAAHNVRVALGGFVDISADAIDPFKGERDPTEQPRPVPGYAPAAQRGWAGLRGGLR